MKMILSLIVYQWTTCKNKIPLITPLELWNTPDNPHKEKEEDLKCSKIINGEVFVMKDLIKNQLLSHVKLWDLQEEN